MSLQSIHSTGYGPRRLYFNGDPNSYTIWETRFVNYLYTLDKGVHKAILPGGEEDDDRDFDEKNRRAYAELVQTLDERSLQLIMHDATNNGREALKILRNHYTSAEKPRVLTLYEELTTLRMSVHEDITDYIIRAEKATTGLKAAGETIRDNLIIAMLLKGLPEVYTSFVVVHTQLDKVKTLTEFKAALHNYSNTESSRSASSQQPSSAMSSSNNSKPPKSPRNQQSCNSCGKTNHTSRNCRVKAKLKCTFCEKPGHVESVCFQKRRDGAIKQNTASNVSFSFSLTDKTMSSSAHRPHSLLVDCGATCHIVNDPNSMIEYDDSFNPSRHYIELANGHRSNTIATAKGTAKFTIVSSTGKHIDIMLKNALLAPTFPVSLFSVRAATDENAKVVFTKDTAELIANHTRFNIVKQGRLYYLPTVTGDTASTTRSLADWHKTLGHMNHEDILKLESVTRGMKITETKRKDGAPRAVSTRSRGYQSQMMIHPYMLRDHLNECTPTFVVRSTRFHEKATSTS